MNRISMEYLKRKYSGRVNRLHINGDLFASESDAYVNRLSLSDAKYLQENILKADVLFCKGDLARNFFLDYSSSLHCKVILIGNSDENFSEIDFPLPRSAKHLFVQNWEGYDPQVTLLPIGVENLALGNNGRPFLLQPGEEKLIVSERILIGPFGNTHPDRLVLASTGELNGPWDYISGRISPKKYSDLVSNYKYVACPRGNGLDTHRFWETLYRGRYPIIISDNWSKNLASHNLPFITVDDWSSNTLQVEIPHFPQRGFNPGNIEALWWAYWKKLIENYIS